MLKSPEKITVKEVERPSPSPDAAQKPQSASSTGLSTGLSKGQSLAGRLAKSLTALLAIIIATIYVLIFYYYPWKDLAAMELPAWVIKYAEKVPDYLRSPDHKPLLFLGSSLVLAPAARLHQPTIYQSAIKKLTGSAPDSKILAVPAAVTSDQLFILRELIAAGKAPKLIVLTVAPRDFIDNEIGDKIDQTPTARVLTFNSHNKDFWPHALSMAAFAACLKAHSTYDDLVRRHFQRWISDMVCARTGHPKNLWDATHKIDLTEALPTTDQATSWQADQMRQRVASADVFNAAVLKRDLQSYASRYQPHNQPRFDKQVSALDDLLATARAAKIDVLLVEMPVTPDNLALLTAAQKANLQLAIKHLATKYDVDFIDYNAPNKALFALSDFNDSVHLNKAGSQHFLPIFARDIAESRAYKASFPSP